MKEFAHDALAEVGMRSPRWKNIFVLPPWVKTLEPSPPYTSEAKFMTLATLSATSSAVAFSSSEPDYFSIFSPMGEGAAIGAQPAGLSPRAVPDPENWLLPALPPCGAAAFPGGAFLLGGGDTVSRYDCDVG